MRGNRKFFNRIHQLVNGPNPNETWLKTLNRSSQFGQRFVLLYLPKRFIPRCKLTIEECNDKGVKVAAQLRNYEYRTSFNTLSTIVSAILKYENYKPQDKEDSSEQKYSLQIVNILIHQYNSIENASRGTNDTGKFEG